jgi:hypothetical protein
MVFHGAIVVVLGLLLGFPFAMALLSDPQGDVRAWRMAHLEGILNGLLVIAVAGVGRHLNLTAAAPRVLAWSLIGMAYGNVVASALGAASGVRGLEPAGPAVNLIVYVLFVLAIVAVFVAMGLVVYGARPEPTGSATGGEDRPSDPTGEPTLDLASPPYHSHRRRRRRRRRGPRPGSGEPGSSQA